MNSPNGIVVKQIERAEAEVIATLQELGVATIHEALGRTGLMHPEMRPIYHELSIAYRNPGDVEEARGNLDNAIKRYERAVIAAEVLADGLPGETSLRKDLKEVQRRLAELRRARG